MNISPDLAIRALEELSQLGYKIEGDLLYPPDRPPTAAVPNLPSPGGKHVVVPETDLELLHSSQPGTPGARLLALMHELEKRFPDPEPFSARLPETRYLAALDKALQPRPSMTFPTLTDVQDEMTKVDPGWNAYGRSRATAVALAYQAVKTLLKL